MFFKRSQFFFLISFFFVLKRCLQFAEKTFFMEYFIWDIVMEFKSSCNNRDDLHCITRSKYLITNTRIFHDNKINTH